MAKMNGFIPRILSQCSWWTEFCAKFRLDFPLKRPVFNHPAFPLHQYIRVGATYNCGEKEMVRKEFHVCYFDGLLETMDFETRLVVDIRIFLLSHCKERFIV